MLIPHISQGEYRAYELEVFDFLSKKSEILTTSFAPSDYILTHGGPQRIGIVIRSSWICLGNTSHHLPICQAPPLVSPLFKVGDRVVIQLTKHVTHHWVGIIENGFYRSEIRQNVYGVRFPDHKNVYARYYESDLKSDLKQ